jgi:cytochrome oxidase Cu insertion factor (SCO1/SenC/PrrC family)
MLSPRLLALAVLLAWTASAVAQGGREDPQWVQARPTLGDPFPELTVFTADGKEFKTSSLKGQYTVLAFGCLT